MAHCSTLCQSGASPYSLFLIHFPICLVLTAWIAEYVIDRPHAALGLMILEYAVSLVAAVAFYRLIEGRVARKELAAKLATAAAVLDSYRAVRSLGARGMACASCANAVRTRYSW